MLARGFNFSPCLNVYGTCRRAFASGRAAADAPSTRKFTIFRYDPNTGSTPYFGSYDLDLGKTGPMVLDALIKIKTEIVSGGQCCSDKITSQDPTLAFRRSCREGICGSCAMNIDGVNSLACITAIDPTRKETQIRPLPHMFVLRDLVPDMTNFYQHYTSIQPWLQRSDDKGDQTEETTQSIDDRKKLDGLYEWWHPETYLGPQALLSAHRWIVDSRDEKMDARLNFLNDTMRLYRCHNIGNCSNCCPKGLKPHLAIDHLKKAVSDSVAKQED